MKDLDLSDDEDSDDERVGYCEDFQAVGHRCLLFRVVFIK